jgi:hypothetical protein
MMPQTDDLARCPLTLGPGDVIPTGNDWLALPDIRAEDGAILSLNVLSRAYRGLVQARGAEGRPLMAAVVSVDGQPLPLAGLAWALIAYWVPKARVTVDGVDITLTVCAPPGIRAAFVHLTATNRRAAPVQLGLVADVTWGALERITYQPSPLTGTRSVAPGLWVDDATTFAYRTDDVRFAWSVLHPGMTATLDSTVEIQTATLRGADHLLAPGETAEATLILSVGLDEMSAPHNARALAERLDRFGVDGVLAETARWLMRRCRTTGRADIDLLMNRNALFSRFYAWGRTLDGEDWVGVTSRSPRYYVAAAYWDRDAMLWSFPALLRFDPAMAREALGVALGAQLRNTGTHSRFIDGVVLEDGFQLDAAAAPVIALADYLRATGDRAFVAAHAAAVDHLAATLAAARDDTTGLYASWQDAQDEYRRAPFLTVANVLAWSALRGLADLFAVLGRDTVAAASQAEAGRLRGAILEHLVIERDGRRLFAAGWDGADGYLVEDIPPGSLARLPSLGFIAEDDPVFQATLAWLRSPAYAYSHHGEPFGLPGSYRLPFTTAWVLADHLRLAGERESALAMLLGTTWDGGIISEGIDPAAGVPEADGRAFATAAGYVAAALHDVFVVERDSMGGIDRSGGEMVGARAVEHTGR